MPIFREGNYADLGVDLKPTPGLQPGRRGVGVPTEPTLPRRLSLAAVGELSFALKPPDLKLVKSAERWGLYLKRITLNKSFEGFLLNMFNPTNEVYFTTLAWDYGGKEPFIYPPKEAPKDDFLISRLKKGQSREFIMDGLALWPADYVVGGLNLLMIVYENDEEARAIGERLVAIHEAIGSSQLWKLIGAICVAPQLATGVAVAAAVTELLGAVGKVMKADGNDFVDMFEGTLGTEKKQKPGLLSYKQQAASIQLELTAG